MRFTYKGTGAQGQPVSGETEAESAEAATQQLAKEDVRLTALKPVRPAVGVALTRGVSSADIATFCEQLARLTESRLPLPQSLRALARDANNPALRGALQRVAEGLDAGHDLVELMERERRVFPPLLPALVRAGEASGNLPETLRLAATHTWRMGLLRERVVAALTYPVIVLILLGIIATAICKFVIPQFEDLFADLDVELPALTTVLLFTARHIFAILGAAVGAALLAALLLRVFAQSETGVSARRWVMFHIPLLGRILRASYLSRFCRFMSLLLASGMSLDTALELLGRLDKGTMSPRESEALVEAVRNGSSLFEAMMLRLHVFPDILTWIVGSCEGTGRLPEAFQEAAVMYERDAERNIQVMDALLPGLALIFVSLFVGTSVVGLFLPLIRLMQSIS